MTAFLFVGPDYVSIRADMPLPQGRPGRGLFLSRVRPGQSFGRYTYDKLRQMGNGRHELTFPEAVGGEETPSKPL